MMCCREETEDTLRIGFERAVLIDFGFGVRKAWHVRSVIVLSWRGGNVRSIPIPGGLTSGGRAFLRHVGILVFVLFIPSVTDATPTVVYRTDYYDIRGATAQELRDQMKKLGVRHTDGKMYVANTRCPIKWDFHYSKTRNGCRIDSVTVTVYVTYLYPRWVNLLDGSNELRVKWSRFITALETHEEGHRDRAVDAATRIESAIANLAPRMNCQDLAVAANALGKRIAEELKREQVQYDVETKHGITQGTSFR